MNLEYCSKCSLRIVGACYVDPSNSASRYCAGCGKGVNTLVMVDAVAADGEKVGASSKPEKISSRGLPSAKRTPVKGNSLPVTGPSAVGMKAQNLSPAPQPDQPPPAFSKAGGNMAFYFCESCGRRLNAADLESGRAQNKQVKGVYCTNCAQGVNTISFEAITNEKAVAIRKEFNVQAPPETAGALAARLGNRPKKKTVETARWLPVPWLVVMGIAALAGVVAGFFALRGTPADTESSASPASVASASVAPEKAAPAVVSPSTPLAIVEQNGSRQLAEAVKWFAENPEKNDEYRARLEAIVRNFPSSPAAVEVRSLLAKMTTIKPDPASNVVATPAPPPSANPALVKALEDARSALRTGGLNAAKKRIEGRGEWPAELRAQADEIAAELVKREAEAEAAKKIKQERDAMFAGFDRLMMAGDFKAAREYAKTKAGQSTEMQRGEALALRMADEPAAVVRGAGTLVGRETRLKLKNGVQGAIIKAAGESGLSVATSFTINNEKRERLDTLKWDVLHPEQKAEFARLGGVETNASDAAILATYTALAANDLEAARKSAEGGKGDPLGAYLAEFIQFRLNQLAYEAAMKRAEGLIAEKKTRDAILEYQKALEAMPEDAKALELLEGARSASQTVTLDLGNGVSMELVYIGPGTFVMGGTSNGEGRHKADETPKHNVTLTKGFYLGKYEVTQAQFQAIMGSNPSRSSKAPNYPVDSTQYQQELEFCKKVSERTKRQVRLPTEAEWEFACRAGTDSDWSHGGDSGKLGEYAWIAANSGGQPHPVGMKKPNAWGLHDMHGNISERVGDSYQRGYYASSPKEDPPGAKLPFGNGANGTTILRGGSFKGGTDSSGWDPCQSGTRIRGGGFGFYDSWGFRVAMTVDE